MSDRDMLTRILENQAQSNAQVDHLMTEMNRLIDMVDGNGKPGLRMDVATMQREIVRLSKHSERCQEAKLSNRKWFDRIISTALITMLLQSMWPTIKDWFAP